MADFYFLNGQIVAKEEAKVSVGDLGIARGYGTFDYFQVKEGIALYMEEHVNRFFKSMDHLHINCPYSKGDLYEAVDSLIRKNEIDFAGVKMIATGGESPDGVSLANPNISIQILPFSEPNDRQIEEGIKLMPVEYQRLLPHIKSTNYLYLVYLSPQLKSEGALEPLYYTSESVRETARANVFAIINGTLVTTPNKVLYGINRDKTLNLGYPTELRDVGLEEMLEADEVFITGTTKKALAVTAIGDKIIGDGKPGTMTMEIRSKLLQKERDLLS